MAGETYYFFFSIIFALAGVLQIANAIYFRTKGRTLIGSQYKPGTIEYERFSKFSSPRYLVATTLVTLLLIANLIFDVYHLVHLQNRSYAHFILVFAPVTSIVIFIGATVYAYNTFGDGHSRK